MLKKVFLVLVSIYIIFIISSVKKFNISSSIITNNNLKRETTSNTFLKYIYPTVQKPIGRLIINKINVNQPIYTIDSSINQVDLNVEILKGSILPTDNNNSIIFLAAHSGNSNVSYFNNLDKLNKGDIINFYYNSNKYNYIVNNKFEQDKDGNIEIRKESNNQLVLTTCSTTNNNKQLIITSNLTK